MGRKSKPGAARKVYGIKITDDLYTAINSLSVENRKELNSKIKTLISKYTEIKVDLYNDDVIHDENKGIPFQAVNNEKDIKVDLYSEIKVNQNNDDAVRDEIKVYLYNDGVRRDEIQLTDSEINDLLLNSEFDPDYKSKAKANALKRLSMKKQSLYQEHLTQAELERRAEEVLQAEIFN